VEAGALSGMRRKAPSVIFRIVFKIVPVYILVLNDYRLAGDMVDLKIVAQISQLPLFGHLASSSPARLSANEID
jgi:hypothetical protein